LFLHYPGFTVAAKANEEALVKRADLVIATSHGIAENLHARTRILANVVSNAVDYDAFAIEPPALPADLAAIPAPSIASIGNINRKVDFSLLAGLARDMRDLNFVLVGGINEAAVENEKLRPLLKSPNVHWLGHKTKDELPAYATNMDVNLMCYKADDTWVA